MKRIIVLLVLMITALTFSVLKVNGFETTSEELRDGIYCDDQSNLCTETFNYEVTNIVKHNKGFIVVGKAEDKEELQVQLEFYITYPYIAYYDSTGIVWSFVDKTIGHGEYRDAKVVGNEVVAVGTYETGDGQARLLMTRFNGYGNVKGRINFDANKSTFGYKLLYENNKLFVLGLTNATHFLIDTNNISNKIFVLKLDSNYQKDKIVFIHNGDNSVLYDACMANGIIYIHGHLSAGGEYDVESPLPVDGLFSMDTSLNDIYYCKIIHHKFLKIACNEDGLYVFRGDNKLTDLVVDEYSYGLEKRNFINLYSQEEYDIDSIAVSSSNLHEPICCYVSSHSGDYYSSLVSIGLQLDVIDNNIRVGQSPNVGAYVFSLEGCYYLFSNIETTRDVNRVIYVEEIDGQCYANGIMCNCVIEEIDTNIYGEYDQKVSYFYGGLRIDYYRDYYVPIRVSIVDKSVYDRKVKLTFNGTGYLNNEKIDSGYIVTEEGKYVLEVRGKNESQYYTFEVKTLVIDEEEFTEEEPVVTVNKVGGATSTRIDNYDTNNSSINKVTLTNFNDKVQTNYYVVIGVVAVGFLIGLLVPFGSLKKRGE